MKKLKNSTTIAVAMSGGVDSSVAASLLKDQGYAVVGFFMKNFGDTFGLKASECPWLQDREDAMRAAAKLDIPFHTLDFEEEYQNQVLDYFFREYEAGRTPNPDVMCNSQIKFGVFLDKALALGADAIATGHYARTKTVILNSVQDQMLKQVQHDDGVQLLKGVDSNKDQSYFLYRLTQKQLSKTMFPVGGYTKPEVRQLAKKFGLPNHDKRDSQGVCFIGHVDLRKFLSQKIKDKPGDIVTVDGKKIGEHTGLFWYTIGQRKGINIGGKGPYYVVAKDFKSNELLVTNDSRDERLFASKVVINDSSWVSGRPPLNPPQGTTPEMLRSFWGPLGKGGRLTGRVRYREKLTECAVKALNGGQYEITFKEPQWAVASGQSVVLYDGEVCLGGGIIC